MVIGIDVAKADLVIAARPRRELDRTERGAQRQDLVDRLTKDQPELIVLEATGG